MLPLNLSKRSVQALPDDELDSLARLDLSNHKFTWRYPEDDDSQSCICGVVEDTDEEGAKISAEIVIPILGKAAQPSVGNRFHASQQFKRGLGYGELYTCSLSPELRRMLLDDARLVLPDPTF